MSSNLPFADVRVLREPLSLETRPVACEMSQRTHEFGVRQAPGARAADIAGLVLGRAIRYIVPGLAVGLGLALIATRWVKSLLFDVSPRDPLVYTAVGLTLLAAALVAALGPAWRARRSDPVAALRQE